MSGKWVRSGPMRLQTFFDLITAEFGEAQGSYIVDTHVISNRNATARELLEEEIDPREVWWDLAKDFQIPEERLLGPDIP